MTDRKELKSTAKDRIKAVRPRTWIVALIFLLVGAAMLFLDQRIITGNVDWKAMEADMQELSSQVETWEDLEAYYTELSGRITETQSGLSPMGKFLSMALEILLVIWTAGFPLYSLRIWRLEKPEPGTLFDVFGIFFKIYFLDFIKRLLLSVGYMLMIVPGVVLSYSFRQSRYLLFDHPEWPVGRCLLESARLMRGKKWKLFMLDLSFLGWGLLSFVPGVILYTMPLINISEAGFYAELVRSPGGEDEYKEPTDGEKPPWEY